MPVSAVAVTLIVILALGIVALIVSMVVIFVPRGDNRAFVNDQYWGYSCTGNQCRRHPLRAPPGTPQMQNLQSLNMCQLTCGVSWGNVWPIPRQFARAGRTHVSINHEWFNLNMEGFESDDSRSYWAMAWERFMEMQRRKVPEDSVGVRRPRFDYELQLNINVESDSMRHDLSTNETYNLNILMLTAEQGGGIQANLTAPNFYGARHGLETLSQLMTYDDFTNTFRMLNNLNINDSPSYPHRGVSMDTSRNFYPVENIKRTLDGLAMVKMNTFHWHITDSQSFPMTVEKHPFLTEVGAYSPREVYTREEMKEITTYARARGIRVVPEFDQPAHVGEGWNFKDMLTCFGAMPWSRFCYQAPCGQFDPSVDELFEILEDIYQEMNENFEPTLFHMGADEVRYECWNTSQRVRDFMEYNEWDWTVPEGFMSLWGDFQKRVEARYDKVANEIMPIILWSSSLTEQPYLTRYLNSSRHIIQFWGRKDQQEEIQQLVENNFRIIFSNHDRLYLDCGFSGWTGGGLNWCEPFKNWQGMYDNRLDDIVQINRHLILGAETTIWSEQIDPLNLDTRLWPRTAALAERLWTNPFTGWQQAETRMVIQRHRMVEVTDVRPDRQYPEWCRQHQGICPWTMP